MTMKRYLTTAEVGDIIRETSENVSRRCAAGQIPATKVGHQWRIAEDDFVAWMQPTNLSRSSVRSTANRRRAS